MKSRRCFKEILISTNSSEFAKRNENVRYNRRLKACLFEEVFISINSFGNLEEMTLANCEPGFKNISLPVECIYRVNFSSKGFYLDQVLSSRLPTRRNTKIQTKIRGSRINFQNYKQTKLNA